jgi:hypothetical protein
MIADWTAILFGRLKLLQIPYPATLNYAPLLIPGGCLLLWILTVRRWPLASALVTLVLCVWLGGMIPSYAESKVAHIPVVRWPDTQTMNDLKSRLGAPILASGSRDGEFLLVRPQDEQLVRDELIRLGMPPRSQ